MKRPFWIALALLASLLSSGCEDAEVDIGLMASAGVDALKAVVLSDEAVKKMAVEAAQFSDGQNRVAPSGSVYARRLKRLASLYVPTKDELAFDFRVYLNPELNAFAMADGSIRLYSGLMDVMNDSEVLFIMGHEMGHVAHDHSRNQIRLAYASRALRKGAASFNNEVGEIARSQLGDFVEQLLNAQYSQKEEKEADDYGLGFLQNIEVEPMAAVSSLQKLASSNSGHSFLSSHPNPKKRYKRILRKLQ